MRSGHFFDAWIRTGSKNCPLHVKYEPTGPHFVNILSRKPIFDKKICFKSKCSRNGSPQGPTGSYLTWRGQFFEPVRIQASKKCPDLIFDEKRLSKIICLSSFHCFLHQKIDFFKTRFSSKMRSGHFFDAWDQPESKN